jgi:hypothetical protein
MNFLKRNLLFTTAVVFAVTAIQFSASGQTRIRFKPGASSATVSGRIAKDEVKCFVLGTNEGQDLTAVLSSPSKTIQFPFAFGAGPEKGGKRYTKTTSGGDEEVCIENFEKATTFSLTISIRTNPQTASGTSTENQTFDNWLVFWQTFQSAVRRHERTKIKSLMSPRFEWALDGYISRDEAFKYLDSMKVWPGLQNAITKRPVECKPSNCNNRAGYHVWSSPKYRTEIMFEQINGRWWWTAVLGD